MAQSSQKQLPEIGMCSLLLDDFNRAMWVYLLKNKSVASDAFKKYRVLVDDSAEKKIKKFRTDRGGEFRSYKFKTYYE